ncbi:hypothetical protein CAPTEDRAFT_182424 [Capitella teleta]|uniref:G-protein coupled receptors family 1 profile domain-containing protein n=1 Tax=Capitella teleta TaxID=283909 RepID=R7VBE1_CAPTE|nr:hypothetical protein CAPTEDRAFT_182424 [Capitella teleta]|eukprot:ELU16138.1 hypothetical protein CAPTEDRAFT_182424 [Capitella teleta]
MTNASSYGRPGSDNNQGSVKVALVSLGDNTTSSTACENFIYDECYSNEEYVDLIKEYIFPTTFEWCLIVLYLIVFTLGLVGNFLVVFVVVRNKHMRTITNLFIVNLSVADFLVLLICLPASVLTDVTETWFMGRVMCKLVHYLQAVSVSVSVLTLTVISIERYYAICHPLSFKSTHTRARLMIILVWVISLAIVIPELVILDLFPHKPYTDLLMACKPSWSYTSQAAFQIVLIVALFFLPFCLMGFAYIRIALCLWSDFIPTESCECNKPLNADGKSSHHEVRQQVTSRRNVAKMLIAVVIMFGICYLPVHLLNILRYAKALMNGVAAVNFALIAHWLCYFNSAINPLIYNFMSAKFRKEFMRACGCCFWICSPAVRSNRNQGFREGTMSYRYSNSATTHTEHIMLNPVNKEKAAELHNDLYD